MRLVDDWRAVLRYAWSIRLIALAGLLTVADGILQALDIHSMTLTVAAALVNGAAFMSRIIAQEKTNG